MNNENFNKSLDTFMSKTKTTKKISDTEREECDIQTGECYVITVSYTHLTLPTKA